MNANYNNNNNNENNNNNNNNNNNETYIASVLMLSLNSFCLPFFFCSQLARVCYIYYLSKFVEYLDTVSASCDGFGCVHAWFCFILWTF